MVLAELVDPAVAGVTRAAECGPNHGQVVYWVMSRPVVAVLGGELECWVSFSPHAQRWLHVVSWCSPSQGVDLYAQRPRRCERDPASRCGGSAVDSLVYKYSYETIRVDWLRDHAVNFTRWQHRAVGVYCAQQHSLGLCWSVKVWLWFQIFTCSTFFSSLSQSSFDVYCWGSLDWVT